MIRYAGRSETGCVRDINEDNLYMNGKIRSPEQESFEENGQCSDDKSCLFAVCDGIGGAACGEEASLLVVQQLSNWEDQSRSEDLLDQCVLDINAAVCREFHIQEGAGPGTTFAALLLEEDVCSVCNVGDSRVYLLREGELVQLSRDHTQAQQMIDSGLISQEDARFLRQRHVLTQYIGVPEQEFVLSPHLASKLPLQFDDRFLLCSDGLYEMMSEEDILPLLEAGSPQEAADRLTGAALDRGGRDNVTVIVVEVTEGNDSSRRRRDE